MRQLNLPRPAPVRERDGVPAALGAVPVEAIREAWVVGPIGWWRGRPVHRRCYELVLADGRLRTVFWDTGERRWFSQRG